MRFIPVYMAALLLGSLAPVARSQDYTGTYVTQGDRGPVTLTLRQDAAGNVVGQMAGGGEQFQVEGMIQSGSAVGMVYNASQRAYFEATLSGGQLLLALMEVGPDGAPNYNAAWRAAFTPRGGGVTSQGPAVGHQGAPLSARDGQGRSGLQGTWSCQTGQGTARLVFESASQLEFNGQRLPYQLMGDAIRVPDDYGPVDYHYRLSGDALTIAVPDGSTMQCRRATGPGGPVAAQAPGQGGMNQLLQGRLCSYSSSPDGGYSRSTRVTFDGQGRFSTSSEASWSVESGWGYGQHPGDMGGYRVGGGTVGSPVYLTFADGSSGVAQIHHMYQGMITELMYEGTLFGRGLCD